MTTTDMKQGCGLSPYLFNIYLDDIRQFKIEINPGIKLHPTNRCINTLLFADDQIIILQESKNVLQ